MLRPEPLCACALVLFGCAGTGPEASEVVEPSSAPASAELSDGDHDVVAGGHTIVGRELPGELVAELRLRGDDADGRLLTLAPGFVATAACSDCGAPSYLRFLAVRCADPLHCEVLTEQCEGSIERDAKLYELEFRAVEGAPEEDTVSCTDYSGTFELP